MCMNLSFYLRKERIKGWISEQPLSVVMLKPQIGTTDMYREIFVYLCVLPVHVNVCVRHKPSSLCLRPRSEKL